MGNRYEYTYIPKLSQDNSLAIVFMLDRSDFMFFLSKDTKVYYTDTPIHIFHNLS